MKRMIARGLATLTGVAFTLLPRPHRFRVAKRIALTLAPLLRISRFYERRGSLLDGHREEAVRLAVHAMRRLRIAYDPMIRVDGATPPEGAAIIACGHFLLNNLMLRWLLDRGDPVVMIANSPDPVLCYSGTAEPIDTIDSSGPVPLVRARRRLAGGAKIMVMIDDENAEPAYVRVDTAVGPRYLSAAIPRLAERVDVPVFFGNLRVDASGELVFDLRALPRSAPEAFEACCRYLVEDAARIQR